jgi:hypothetical protein
MDTAISPFLEMDIPEQAPGADKRSLTTRYINHACAHALLTPEETVQQFEAAAAARTQGLKALLTVPAVAERMAEMLLDYHDRLEHAAIAHRAPVNGFRARRPPNSLAGLCRRRG